MNGIVSSGNDSSIDEYNFLIGQVQHYMKEIMEITSLHVNDSESHDLTYLHGLNKSNFSNRNLPILLKNLESKNNIIKEIKNLSPKLKHRGLLMCILVPNHI